MTNRIHNPDLVKKLMRALYGTLDGPEFYDPNGCGESSGFGEDDGAGSGQGNSMIFSDFTANGLLLRTVGDFEGTGAGDGYGESSLKGYGHGDGMADFYDGFDNFGYGCDVGAAFPSGAGYG